MEDIVVAVDHISKKYGKKSVLKNISFTLEKGEICGLAGINGAGKTTLMRIICGLMNSTSGSVNINTSSPVIGYMPQTCRFRNSMRVIEVLQYFAHIRNASCHYEEGLMKILGLDIEQKVRVLSPGQYKKMMLEVAMTGRPGIYVLDEPTAGLDPRATQEMLMLIEELAREGSTVLVSSHIISHLEEICQTIAVLGPDGEFIKEEWDKGKEEQTWKDLLYTC